jgi:hypothetical protein
MPEVKPGESEKEFIPRCISYVSKEHSDWDNDKCVAVCYSIYRRSKENAEIPNPSGNVDRIPQNEEPGDERIESLDHKESIYKMFNLRRYV